MNLTAMIEVFKTCVTEQALAMLLRKHLELGFPGYKVNFDLEDCDRILRIEHRGGVVNAGAVIDMLRDWGVLAAVLGDEVPSTVHGPQATADYSI
jgi:hypothetical protein